MSFLLVSRSSGSDSYGAECRINEECMRNGRNRRRLSSTGFAVFTENKVRRFVLPTDAEIIQSWRIGNNGTFLYVIHH